MTARFDHLIIAARDRHESARFYGRLLEAPCATSQSPAFAFVRLGDGVCLDFTEPPVRFPPQHYAFRLDDQHFDRVLAWTTVVGLAYWADLKRSRSHTIDCANGCRSLYLLDPAGHYLELMAPTAVAFSTPTTSVGGPDLHVNRRLLPDHY